MATQDISRRRFLKGLVAVTGGAALAACAAPTPQVIEKVVKETVVVQGTPQVVEKQVTQVVEKQVVQTQVVEKQVTAAPPTKAAPTEVRVSHWWPQNWHSRWFPIVQEQANVKIKEEIYPFGEYNAKLLTQVAAGTAPDVIQLDQGHNGNFFPRDVLVPFDDALAAAKVDMKKWNVDPKIEVGYKGKILGMPLFMMQALICWINVDLAEKAGYNVKDLPVWGTPKFDTWTWDDALAFMKQTTKQKADGTYEQYGCASARANAFSLGFQLASYGQNFLDDVQYSETKALLDSPEAIQAATQLVELTTVHKVAPTLEAQQGVPGGLFRAGKAVLEFGWAQTILIDAKLPFKLEMIHLPFVKRRVSAIGPNHFCVNKASKVIGAAQRMSIFHATSREVGLEFLRETGNFSAYDTAWFLSYLPEGPAGTLARINLARRPGMSECAYCAKDVFFFDRAGYGKLGSFVPNTINPELEKALLGQKTVAQALKDANKIINDEIAKNK
jgi:ABC-type glycerol-3-phosphate transport system substrate-binding protein